MTTLKTQAILFGLITPLLFSFGMAGKNRSLPDLSQEPYPKTLTQWIAGAERFEDNEYFQAMASDAILKVDSRQLYARIQAAATMGDLFKALFLSRIFSSVEPSLPRGWMNRAQLAHRLGLQREAEACEARAKGENLHESIPLGPLPGEKIHRPNSFRDWVGLILLIADGVNQDHAGGLVAIADMVSGIKTAQDHDGSNPRAWAEPISIGDIAPNLFIMGSGQPMKYTSLNKGAYIGGWLAMAGAVGAAATGTVEGSTASAVLFEGSGDLLARAEGVPSHYQGGSFVTVRVPEGDRMTAVEKPRPSGEAHAVNIPIPILWASFPSLSASGQAKWVNHRTSKKEVKATAVRIRPDDLKLNIKDEKVRSELRNTYKVPAKLHFAKFESFCGVPNIDEDSEQQSTYCTIPFTPFEILLEPADITALFPQLKGPRYNLNDMELGYRTGTLTLGGHPEEDRIYYGVDDTGVVYVVRHSKIEWIIPVRNYLKQRR